MRIREAKQKCNPLRPSLFTKQRRKKSDRRQCRMSPSLTCKETLRQVFIRLGPPPPPRLLFGAVKQFCRFGIWSYMLSTQPDPTPLRYTLFISVFRLEIAYMQSCRYFRPNFVISTLPFFLVQLSPPLPCVNKYTVYTYTVQCVKGGRLWGSRPQTDKHLPQSPFTGQFF